MRDKSIKRRLKIGKKTRIRSKEQENWTKSSRKEKVREKGGGEGNKRA